MKKAPRLILLLCTVILPTLAIAQAAPHSVVVEVRTVEASGAIPASPQSLVPVSDIDSRIEDLRVKLQKLHYKTFRLLGVQSQVVPLMQKSSLSLANGHSLLVRPLYILPGRIGLWLKWSDRSGMEVLDTRLHFDPGESMLTGTDADGDKGVVLAIDVKPAG